MGGKTKVKLGVIGGRRGAAFNTALKYFSEKVVLSSICDISEEVVARWKADFPWVKGYTSFETLLYEDDCNAVFIATPRRLHANQAIKAMRAGKHVLSEVPAALTLDECWELVETVERTGLTYMLAENYCYTRPNMMVLNMAQKGIFGEITYAEGAYIHDCRQLFFCENGQLTWRGQEKRDVNGNTYPTHSLGPIAQWLGINQNDRLVLTSTWMAKTASTPRYAERNFGKEHPGAKREFWSHGDSATTLIETQSEAVIVLRVDSTSARPHNMTHYVLQGTTASYVSPRYEKDDPLIWIEGRSPTAPDGTATGWECLWDYADEFEHPRWKRWGDVAREAGHGGGDFFALQDFVDAILQGTRPPIDVYDAVTWSSIIPLSIESVKKKGAPVEIPDFTKGGR
ncbi:MAG: Gfo/Idh/MocA family oxidoreductase [Firmicutes bacterium]|nr:Gfo/Idh/MocA family oxidoreductase [Bacillota bacterium]